MLFWKQSVVLFGTCSISVMNRIAFLLFYPRWQNKQNTWNRRAIQRTPGRGAPFPWLDTDTKPQKNLILRVQTGIGITEEHSPLKPALFAVQAPLLIWPMSLVLAVQAMMCCTSRQVSLRLKGISNDTCGSITTETVLLFFLCRLILLFFFSFLKLSWVNCFYQLHGQLSQ